MTDLDTKRATPLTRYIAEQVRTLRKERGLSHDQLADRMNGIPDLPVHWGRTSVQKLENGRRATIAVEELLALAAVLGIPASRLLPADRRCGHCHGMPPAGFTCNHCRSGAE